MSRKLLGLSCVLIIALATIASGCATGAPAEKLVKMGGNFEMTGPMAGFGLAGSEGFRLAVQQINEKGGFTVAGQKYKIEAIVEDNRGEAAEAVAAAQKLVSKDGVKFMFGPMASPTGGPTIDITQKAKVIQFVSATSVIPMVGKPENPTLFMAMPPDSDRASKYVPYVAKTLGIKTIAILMANDSGGQAKIDNYAPEFEKAGIKILVTERFNPAATEDLYPVLTKIKATKPDALFWGTNDGSGKSVIRQAVELDVTKNFLATEGPTSISAQGYEDKLDNFIWPIHTRSMESKDTKVVDWIQKYEAFYGKKPIASTFYALMYYDYVFMMTQAMSQAGTVVDTEKIANAYRGMSYSGVMNISIDQKGLPHHDFELGSIQRGKVSYLLVGK